ncbi:MAG: D-ribose pyranase [Clostridium sp.]
MKKTGILNTHICSLIAELGHQDMIAIVDASVSIPEEVKKIDLVLTLGIPSLEDTMKAVLEDMESNEIIIAMETEDENPVSFKTIKALAGDRKLTRVSNEQLKLMLKKCRGVIRCGEGSPYSSLLIKSASIF